jgi:D-alanyl-D-alanine carboxypeptidase/D-alanyl-D-alanine-endopeptidase (penicillin-binding protein 4)
MSVNQPQDQLSMRIKNFLFKPARLSVMLAALLVFVQVIPVLAQSPTPAPQQPAAPPETLAALQARIAAHIAQPRFAPAAWGIKIVALDSGKTLFEHNAGKYFNPASNAKLYTAALALARLGADYRIRTSLYSTVRPDATGMLKGDVIVYGRGDPMLTASLNGGDYFKSLEPLAQQLASAGVRRIEGDLVGDESYFATPPIGAGWEWDDLQEYYGAEVSALTLNDNALDLFAKPAERAGQPCRLTTGPATAYVTLINRTQTAPKGTEARITVYRPVGDNIVYVSGRLPLDHKGYRGSVSVHNPAALFATLFKESLARRGILVTGRTRTIDWKYREVTPINLAKLVELGYVESPPLKDIVRETLKPSQNLYAQLLLLQVGANAGRDAPTPGRADTATGDASAPSAASQAASDERPEQTTEQKGVEALNAFLTEAGVKKGDVLLEEGSGLSRKDVITPNATVALLGFMNRHAAAEDYRNALPIAGVDGTLQNRMKGTLAAGNARAKTGTLRYVYTLSGYVTTAAGERVAFSILLNNYYNTDRSTPARDDIDAIVVMLAGFTGSSR